MSKYANNVIENALSINEEERSIVHIITDETVNRYGQIVRMDGMDTTGYDKNPVVFFNHRSDLLPIGRNVWHKNEVRNGVKSKIAKTQFHDSEQGNTIFNMWKDKFLNASSIGFIPTEVKPIFNANGQFEAIEFVKTDLGEYSIVGVPANKNALRNSIGKYGSGLIINSIMEEVAREEEAEGKIASLENELSAIKQELELIKNGVGLDELKTALAETNNKLEALMVENVARKRKEKFDELLKSVRSV